MDVEGGQVQWGGQVHLGQVHWAGVGELERITWSRYIGIDRLWQVYWDGLVKASIMELRLRQVYEKR